MSSFLEYMDRNPGKTMIWMALATVLLFVGAVSFIGIVAKWVLN